MAYNPAQYEARRRGYTQQFASTGAMNAYANYLGNQRGSRQRQDIVKQYAQAQPRVVEAYSQRGLQGPNVQSGLFAQAMQEFAQQRATSLGDWGAEQTNSQRLYDLQESQREEAFRNQLADMESEKAQTIAQAARQLFQNRAGGF